MSSFHESDRECAAELRQTLQERYGCFADQSRQMIIRYLEQYDSERLGAYLGYANVKNCYLTRAAIRLDINLAEHLIINMIRGAARGNEVATPLMIDIFARKYLRLPYVIIDGGASE